MGFATNRPPLPAPTEPSTLDSADDTNLRSEDIETNVSTRTDKTSYSVPEDGTPITINTTKPQGGIHKKYPSQTSLLIEYFEAGKTEGKARSRPSVRVRVTPSSRKSKNRAGSEHVQITKTSTHPRKPSYTRRISLGSKPRDEVIDTRTIETYSDGSNISSIPPVEIEVLHNHSDLSSNGGQFVPMPSDISSMPPDSMLEGRAEILPPGRRRSRSLERESVLESMAMDKETLKAPKEQRSRSMSKDRITQRVMEKLAQQQAAEGSSKTTKKITKEEIITSPRKSHRRRSKDVEEVSAISGTESSLLSSNADRRSGLSHSARSGVSATSSINNPKLLATVEDAIKRLILPELNALKEENRTSRNREKFEHSSRETNRDSGTTYDVESTTSSREHSRRRVSKSSSAPKLHNGKPKVVLNRHGDDPGVVLSGDSVRKERRSSRGSTSDRSYADSTTRETTREKSHRRKSRDKESTTSVRDAELAGLAGAGLTAAALKSHTSREEKEEDRKHKKRHSSRSSRSRSASVSESVEDVYQKEHVPPLPFNHSELIGSELTRDSILSAETETKERRSSISSGRTGTGAETPLQQVPRGFMSPAPRTPTRTPNALQQTLGTAHSNRSTGEYLNGTPKSDRSYSSRSREVTTASLEAAAAAKARAIERSDPQASQFEIAEDTPGRDVSPIQSEASYRHEVHTTGSPHHLRSFHSAASVSSLGQPERLQSAMSIQSIESTTSTKAARTRKRPQGITLESKRSVLGEPETPRDAEDFFASNHVQNEMYRRELEESSQASPSINYGRMSRYTNDSAEGQYLDHEQKLDMSPDVRKVGITPEYVHTPLAVESAVASLHEHDTSNISVRSSTMSSPLKKSLLSNVTSSPKFIVQEDGIPSGERWATIRDKAEALVQQGHAENSPRQSIAESIEERQTEEHPQMHHSAFPTDDHLMPEIGYGVDDDSDVTTNPSIIQGPLGGGDGYHDQSDELLSRQEDRERTPTSFTKGGALGAGAGAAAIAAAAAHHLNNQSPLSYDERRQATVEDEYDEPYAGETQHEQPGYAHSNRTPTSGNAAWRDEGYQSANAREAYTPQNRNYSRMFDDDGLGEDYDENGAAGEDLGAANAQHNRQVSGNSHGMASPLYDSATGKGLDRIQSKDIVALMDHLTVRDAQRNARDTEILVTLVRSAAEMRNQLDDLKQFIKTQDNMIVGTTDKRVNLAEQRILGGPRPQPMSSPRANRSSSEDIDIETKKKNVFKRALKGLSMKGDSDMKHIESMLMQLLDEVEGLKHVNQLTLDQQARSNSLTSYENLRASGDPGYEPEGRANTNSSPDQSGYLSNHSSARRIQDLHSGYDVPATNRVSTVREESDEEYDERDKPYENTERMTTPTQEVFHERKMSQETPPQASRAFRDPQSQENTPKRKHKSNSSSIFGIPKISRWSKTTSSTNHDTIPRNSESSERRPYSTHSRSCSQVNDEYYDDDQYEVQHDDRLRSQTSLSREERASIRSARSPSPLIPEEDLQYEMEDPKYQAHRNSLNLQHPQPRAGPTGRHQNHLETQARIYEPMQSPDYDQWGSMPALARNRLSAGSAPQGAAGHLSPISSDGGYSQRSASEQQHAAPARPPKVVDDGGPLIPSAQQQSQQQHSQQQQPLAGYGQTRQMYSSPNEFGSQGALTPLAPIAEVRYSLETDRGRRSMVQPSPTPSPRPSAQHLSATNSPGRKIAGPRPMGSRSPSNAHAAQQQQQAGLTAANLQNNLQHSDTVVRRKPVPSDQESLQSYRSSLDSEIF